MFRATSIIPIFLAVAAFVLSLLVLLAGYKDNFLPSVYVLKVDTTNLGTNTTVDLDSTINRIGLGNSTISRFLDRTNITDSIESRINSKLDKIDDLIDTAAAKLGVSDVYIAHMMTFCEAVKTGDSDSNKTTITGCSNPKLPYAFDPLDEISNRLSGSVTLEKLGVETDAVEKVINALQVAYKAMSITLVIGIALAGLSILTGLVGFAASRLVEFCNGLVAWTAFLMLGVASAIATAIAVKGRNVINEYAKDAGVVASESKPLLGMVWGATAAMFLAALWWSFVCCCGSHHRKNRDEPLVEKSSRFGRGRRTSRHAHERDLDHERVREPRTRRGGFGGFGGLFGRKRRSVVV